jgi:hypothetical protein
VTLGVLLVAVPVLVLAVFVAVEYSPYDPAPPCGRAGLVGNPLVGQYVKDWPFGEAVSCRHLDRDSVVPGEVDVRDTLLLVTRSGLVLLRLDYHDLDRGRQHRVVATEVAPGDAPGVSADEERRHRVDTAARGGARADEWILDYGDG